MINALLPRLGQSLPMSFQRPLRYVYGAIPFHIRQGKVFRQTYAFLQQSQWWPKERLEEYQIQQLGKLLVHAYENVPYYRRVFDDRGLKPKDIREPRDLRKLPYLTKDIVQENLADLLARNYSKWRLQYATTGGSTGIPLGFYRERGVSEAREWAFILSLWNRVGFRTGDRSIVLRGRIVSAASKGKFWQYDPVNKNLILSSYHLTDDNLKKYVSAIRDFEPDFVQTYPSAITILAHMMREHGVEPFPSVKAILCGSENLYLWQRQMLEDVFRCRVFSWYGHAEVAVLAGECERSTCYHVFPEYGIAELVGETGEPVNDDNDMGEIVATGLNNLVCPLIRYRTADLAVPSNRTCECGRNYPLLKRVEGRLQELIITRTNRLISMTAINMHSDVFDNVRQFQFCQERKGEVVISLVRKESYTERDTEHIREELCRKLGGDVDLSFEFVDCIPLTPRGKHRFLIQKLPLRFGD